MAVVTRLAITRTQATPRLTANLKHRTKRPNNADKTQQKEECDSHDFKPSKIQNP
uniref:Uncharacterized protein n=1 Tax=Daucus carota subsp. sativus TaxID=79200 RepID=A0A166CTT4_DAUCS